MEEKKDGIHIAEQECEMPWRDAIWKILLNVHDGGGDVAGAGWRLSDFVAEYVNDILLQEDMERAMEKRKEKGLWESPSSGTKNVMHKPFQPKTKESLLAHYMTREPCRFIQYDVFVDVGTGDSVVHPDKDNMSLFAGETYELMSGGPGVRVLLRPDVSKRDAVLALLKIAVWIDCAYKQDGAQDESFVFEDDIPF